jgi:peptidylprolyl isomerase
VKALMLIASLCLAIAIAGCGDDDSSDGGSQTTTVETSGDASNREKPTVTVSGEAAPTELIKNDLIEGTGAEAKSGDEVTVQYVGVGYDSKEEFDASWNRNEPFTFQLGAGQVIPGWDQGVEGMKVGGQRELIVPAELAYGPEGRPPAIGPNEPLVFVIDLLEVG